MKIYTKWKCLRLLTFLSLYFVEFKYNFLASFWVPSSLQFNVQVRIKLRMEEAFLHNHFLLCFEKVRNESCKTFSWFKTNNAHSITVSVYVKILVWMLKLNIHNLNILMHLFLLWMKQWIFKIKKYSAHHIDTAWTFWKNIQINNISWEEECKVKMRKVANTIFSLVIL